MNFKLLLGSTILAAAPILATAAPILVVGTPGNSQLNTPTGPSPRFGTLINFDGLTPNSTFAPGTYASQGVTSISSPDGLMVEPFSTQSFPNELFDESTDGTADITIALAGGVNAIGIGIADIDPVSVTFQALGLSGAALGSPFTEDLATTEDPINIGNGYYVISDSTADIYGLAITQTSANPALYSGLAIDDPQITPEPSSFLLLITGAGSLFCFRRRKRA
jgi:hypothetical protein